MALSRNEVYPYMHYCLASFLGEMMINNGTLGYLGNVFQTDPFETFDGMETYCSG